LYEIFTSTSQIILSGEKEKYDAIWKKWEGLEREINEEKESNFYLVSMANYIKQNVGDPLEYIAQRRIEATNELKRILKENLPEDFKSFYYKYLDYNSPTYSWFTKITSQCRLWLVESGNNFYAILKDKSFATLLAYVTVAISASYLVTAIYRKFFKRTASVASESVKESLAQFSKTTDLVATFFAKNFIPKLIKKQTPKAEFLTNKLNSPLKEMFKPLNNPQSYKTLLRNTFEALESFIEWCQNKKNKYIVDDVNVKNFIQQNINVDILNLEMMLDILKKLNNGKQVRLPSLNFRQKTS
jgi:hypothetical protein